MKKDLGNWKSRKHKADMIFFQESKTDVFQLPFGSTVDLLWPPHTLKKCRKTNALASPPSNYRVTNVHVYLQEVLLI